MDPNSTKFTWIIDKFSRLRTKKKYSDIFTVGGYQWQILIFPKGNNAKHLSVYLSVADSATLPNGWSRHARFSLTLVNQIDEEFSIKEETTYEFNAEDNDCGFNMFIPLSDLIDPDLGYIMKNTIVVQAEVFAGEPDISGKQVFIDLSNTSSDDKTGICFEEMATTLLKKLEDNKAIDSVRIDDFKLDIESNNYVHVGMFTVPESLEPYAKDLLAKHADIGSGNSTVQYFNEMAFVVLCCALKSMHTTPSNKVTETLIFKWWNAVRGALLFGFEVTFLNDHLKSVTQAYLATLARNSHESKELQAINVKISAKRKALDSLTIQRKDIQKKMNTELRKTCEAAATMFPARTQVKRRS